MAPTYRAKRQGHVFAGCVRADGRRLVFTGNELKATVLKVKSRDQEVEG